MSDYIFYNPPAYERQNLKENVTQPTLADKLIQTCQQVQQIVKLLVFDYLARKAISLKFVG